jgi:hypothetical protein
MHYSCFFKRIYGIVYRDMKLRYETGIATLIQLVVMLLLNFVNALQSSISACSAHSGCISNIVSNLLFIIVLAIWLMFLSAVGYRAQDKRSRNFATVLIASEALIVLVAAFDIKHAPNILGLITSIVDLALAAWVITLAYRLRKARGGRVVVRQSSRPRRRNQ